MLVRDAPQNIVEFFGASILPHYNGNNHLQLFLELMPGECIKQSVVQVLGVHYLDILQWEQSLATVPGANAW